MYKQIKITIPVSKFLSVQEATNLPATSSVFSLQQISRLVTPHTK
jgi:hypothetical protein